MKNEMDLEIKTDAAGDPDRGPREVQPFQFLGNGSHPRVTKDLRPGLTHVKKPDPEQSKFEGVPVVNEGGESNPTPPAPPAEPSTPPEPVVPPTTPEKKAPAPD